MITKASHLLLLFLKKLTLGDEMFRQLRKKYRCLAPNPGPSQLYTQSRTARREHMVHSTPISLPNMVPSMSSWVPGVLYQS